MALRQYRPDQSPYENIPPKEKQVTYQEYQKRNYHTEQLKEVLFFVNIGIFSILTVFAANIFLALNLPTFLAFVLAAIAGAVGLRGIQLVVRAQFKRIRKKKLNR